jgi:hypothetical protein
MQPNQLLELSKQQLIDKLQEYNLIYDEAMEVLVMIRSELMTRLDEENKDGELIGEYEVAKRKRINIKVPVEKARELGATKEEEVVDNAKIKNLYASGVKIEGVTETIYLSVRRVKQDEEQTKG